VLLRLSLCLSWGPPIVDRCQRHELSVVASLSDSHASARHLAVPRQSPGPNSQSWPAPAEGHELGTPLRWNVHSTDGRRSAAGPGTALTVNSVTRSALPGSGETITGSNEAMARQSITQLGELECGIGWLIVLDRVIFEGRTSSVGELFRAVALPAVALMQGPFAASSRLDSGQPAGLRTTNMYDTRNIYFVEIYLSGRRSFELFADVLHRGNVCTTKHTLRFPRLLARRKVDVASTT
jgi:hypothetical protein